ncbi:MAG TPA: hypothetical protein VHN37_09775 [Actinomycetota bacterium]|nr:hypothetical protein [Actinomycetota bacterium]
MSRSEDSSKRRSLSYIRLAAFLAAQPPGKDAIELGVDEIADLVDEELPANARFPSWWRNDPKRMHSRAWLTAGWEVKHMGGGRPSVLFVRRKDAEPAQ